MEIFTAEVIGTAILILLGDGVVAGRPAREVEGPERGLDRHHVRLGAWRSCVAVYRRRPVQRRASQPGGDHRLRRHGRHAVERRAAVPARRVRRRVHRRDPGLRSPTARTGGETEDPGLKLAVFCTGPAIRNTAANLVTEIIGTFMLVFGVLAIVGHFTADVSGGSGKQLARLSAASCRCWSACSCSRSACRSAARPATRSTPPATSARGSSTRSCRSRARVTRTGATRGSPSSARSSAASLGRRRLYQALCRIPARATSSVRTARPEC